MADPSNKSFIPKRGPVKQKRGTQSRQVYIFSILSYVLLFATLLATGGVFLYGNYIDGQLDNEISALNQEISSFSEGDMQRVLEFDLRLAQASSRLNNSVSIVSLFQAIEQSTIDTVQLEQLALERVGDSSYILTAAVQTDSFDSTIFQRNTFNDRNELFSSVNVTSVDTVTVSENSGTEGSSLRPLVTFSAELEVPLSAIPYSPSSDTAPVVITDEATEAALGGGENASESAEPTEETEPTENTDETSTTTPADSNQNDI